MEPRKIIIVNESMTSCNEIMSTATTVAELKAEMTRNGIVYADKTLVEGRSHTTFERDDQQLPTTVRFRGQETNELSIMLMTPAKKVASGSERGDIYNKIKANNLQEYVKERFGRNFTQVPTSELKMMLDEMVARPTNPQEIAVTPEEALPNTISEIEEVQDEVIEVEAPCTCKSAQVVDSRCREAVMKLLDILEGEGGLIPKWEKDEVLEVLGGNSECAVKPHSEPKKKDSTLEQLKDEFSWLKK